MSTNIDTERRFGGLERLYGSGSLKAFTNMHVIVAGIGGVGSWCIEALARSGVGHLTIIDLDHIAESNINRQIHALSSTLGKAKVIAMANRVHEINPNCRINAVDDFIEPENVKDIFEQSLAVHQRSDANLKTVIIDCTDQISAKIAMLLQAKNMRLTILISGGAGGKTDPFAMRSGDISVATHDALLSRMRNLLRRNHGYPKPNPNKKIAPKMGVWAVWFAQETIMPSLWQSKQQLSLTSNGPQGLSCAGYGSSVTITATMGFALANKALSLA